MKKLLLLFCLYSINNFAMMQSAKEYMWGITRLDEVPQSAQAILDNRNKLIGYHIRSEQNNAVSFNLFNKYRKQLGSVRYFNAWIDSDSSSGPSEGEEKLFFSCWHCEIQNLYAIECLALEEQQWNKEHPKSAVKEEYVQNKDSKKLLTFHEPLKLDYES